LVSLPGNLRLDGGCSCKKLTLRVVARNDFR
jgi:hypothetical protein